MMKIIVNFEADSIEALRQQMEAFLQVAKPSPLTEVQASVLNGTFGVKSTDGREEKVKKAKKAPEPVAPEPEPSDEGITDNGQPTLEVLDATTGQWVIGDASAKEENVTPDAEKAVAAQKLKDQQLSRLRDLFNAGKGSLVRELLAKYGDGAKVFPEVDAKHFPAIKVELDRELEERTDMGWNDHMDFIDMECADCGEMSTWEFWNDTAKARYSGGLGKELGLDVKKSGVCPHCGSTNGTPVEDEED